MKVFSLQKVNSYIQKRRDGVETMDNLEVENMNNMTKRDMINVICYELL